MKIGNENFDMKKYINKGDIENLTFKSIYNCYDRPSETKVNIYNKYYYLLLDNCDNVLKYGVNSYNRFMFTIHAIVEIANKKYYVYITKSRNEIRKIKED